MAAQGAVDGGITDGDPVVALEVPDDTDRPQMVRASEMKDQFEHRRRGRIGVRPSARALVDEPGVSLTRMRAPPEVKQGAGDAEVTAGLPDVAVLSGVVEHLPLPPDIVLGLGHHLPPSWAT